MFEKCFIKQEIQNHYITNFGQLNNGQTSFWIFIKFINCNHFWFIVTFYLLSFWFDIAPTQLMSSSLIWLIVLLYPFACLCHNASLPSSLPSTPVSNSNYTIVNAGHYQDKMLFITASHNLRQYLAYIYPQSALDTATNHISQNSSPELVNKKWIALFELLNRHKVVASLTVKDSTDNDYILVALHNRDDFAECDFYKLTPTEQSNHKSDFYVMTVIQWNGQVWLSSDKPYEFYMIQANHSMAKYAFANTNTTNTGLINWNVIQQKSDFFHLCKVMNAYIMFSKSSCATPIDWSVTTGILNKDRFYLFGHNSVYMFDKSAFDQPDTKVKLLTTTLHNFFSSNQTNQTNETSSAKSIVVCCCYFFDSNDF